MCTVYNGLKYFVHAIYFRVVFLSVSDDEYRALRHHIKSPPGSPRSQSPSRSPRSRRKAKTLSLNLRPPIIIEKGPRGYGFTLQAIRVYFGDTNYYKVHHLVSVSNHATCLFAFLLTGVDYSHPSISIVFDR